MKNPRKENRLMVETPASGNPSTMQRHPLAVQSNASFDVDAVLDNMDTSYPSVAPALSAGISNSPLSATQAPIPIDPEESNYSWMAVNGMGLPAACAASAMSTGSGHSGVLQTEYDASSRIVLFQHSAKMVQRRWANIGRSLGSVAEDAEEEEGGGEGEGGEGGEGEGACHRSSINGRNVGPEDEAEMRNLMDSSVSSEEISGISLEDKMGEGFMREAGNALPSK